jgi:LPS O-antigen subunit length determinant protein (WzzB/FepE family)
MNTQQNQSTISNILPTDEIDLLVLVGTIWRGKWWVVLCSILTTVLGLYYLISVATPMYPARAVVAL